MSGLCRECGRSSNFSCLIAECGSTLSRSKRTPPPHLRQQTSVLVAHHRLQMSNAFWPQKMDHSSMFHSSAIWNWCRYLQRRYVNKNTSYTSHWLIMTLPRQPICFPVCRLQRLYRQIPFTFWFTILYFRHGAPNFGNNPYPENLQVPVITDKRFHICINLKKE
jgi:hypothetical protein